MHSTETLKNLLARGAGLRLDAKAVSINDLSELAAVAHSHNARLTIANANHILKDSLERLAVVGGDYVNFEF